MDVPDRFFTLLASLYIDKLFKMLPPKMIAAGREQTDKTVKAYRDKLQAFLSSKTQYK